MTYRYYVITDPEDGAPYMLLREHIDDRTQQSFKAGIGWIENWGLGAKRMSGEIAETDRITEDEANAIIATHWPPATDSHTDTTQH